MNNNELADAVEARDHYLHDAYIADDSAEFDIDALIEEVETKFPHINWKPCYMALRENAEALGVAYEDTTDEQVEDIAADSCDNLSEEDFAKYMAIVEGVEAAA